MKLSVFCGILVVVLATSWFDAAEGNWCRNCRFLWGKSVLRSRARRTCPFTCGLYCPEDSCSAICAKSCLLLAKADIAKDMKPLPGDFKQYDRDEDGYISLHEFAETVQTDEESTAAVIKITDYNGDRRLSVNEFNAAPYHTEKKPETIKVQEPPAPANDEV